MRYLKIINVKLFSDTGKKDHQVPFEGNLNIGELINFSKQKDISMLIEVKTANAIRQSVKILRDKNLIY